MKNYMSAPGVLAISFPFFFGGGGRDGGDYIQATTKTTFRSKSHCSESHCKGLFLE